MFTRPNYTSYVFQAESICSSDINSNASISFDSISCFKLHFHPRLRVLTSPERLCISHLHTQLLFILLISSSVNIGVFMHFIDRYGAAVLFQALFCALTLPNVSVSAVISSYLPKTVRKDRRLMSVIV